MRFFQNQNKESFRLSDFRVTLVLASVDRQLLKTKIISHSTKTQVGHLPDGLF